MTADSLCRSMLALVDAIPSDVRWYVVAIDHPGWLFIADQRPEASTNQFRFATACSAFLDTGKSAFQQQVSGTYRTTIFYDSQRIFSAQRKSQFKCGFVVSR